ncbi:hypothetical protein CONCODRAFT_4266 [Conidiobolus coronatus NRRL 28638]|uniref:G-protein coupled receptors family 1 profile domain-containing protein n=1 Tax=Conidiobolus coronatus (strain ATCC 28846 / CBS 209.66 / NRRL 28638) TaxID=796925 RepID=A0A137PD08_CONC2|nr:hypothetical protein CONCODRAFT_4266 [Conidiobolus coronatus NRRL 28638]|eukprot:KXN72873.1 hypothetical protein CONCODRAFT_4266 [Conidiobolus coronatus NRRL 28638]
MNYDQAVKIDQDNGSYKNGLVALCLIFGISGSLISLFIIIKIAKKPKPIHMDTILSLITIVIGFIASLSNLARGIMIKWPYNIFVYHREACIFEFLTSAMFNSMAVYSICFLSYERMLLIIFKITFSKKIWYTILSVFILLHVTLFILICAHKEFLFSQIAFGCTSNFNSQISVMSKYAAIIYSFCFISVAVNYITIITVQFKRSVKMQLRLNLDKNLVKRENLKILFRSSLIIVCFIVAYIGKDLSWYYQWSTGRVRPWTLDYVSSALQLTHHVANCFIVLYMDPSIYRDTLDRAKLLFLRRTGQDPRSSIYYLQQPSLISNNI